MAILMPFTIVPVWALALPVRGRLLTILMVPFWAEETAAMKSEAHAATIGRKVFIVMFG
jgi:hypothetical protein